MQYLIACSPITLFLNDLETYFNLIMKNNLHNGMYKCFAHYVPINNIPNAICD